ncbi:putative acyl carrier protein [Streptomyces albireticuli]|uniref:Putative acyl carrier protein n=1 Tax=Streptomyces albireticuli TaxID=1940 RepID=A0A1Z2KZ58_9ACTN|nr:acyl carrier protein [Streptomyces albireticuli]ARZ67332.1 putative acyl carrier protein [Streptomyces albireticuli]
MTKTSDQAGSATGTGPDAAGGDIADELLGFLAARTRTTWERDQDLFAVGGMSSLFAMQLVVHLEKTYGVTISGADLMLDNFRTVDAMVRLVHKLGGARAAASAGTTAGE